MLTRALLGSCLLVAACGGGDSATSPTPQPKPVASVAVSPSALSLLVGQSGTLIAQAKDANGAVLPGRTITWSSSDPAIATVSTAGVATGVAPGTATISATSEGKTGAATATVSPVPAASVSVSPPADTLYPAQTSQFGATVKDSAGGVLSGRTVVWTSSNGAIATISTSGLLSAVAVGSATVSASVEGKTGTAAVSVIPVPVASTTVTPGSASLFTGATQQFTATLRDASGNTLTGRPVTWSTSSISVAMVNSASGLVTAVAVGTATITATSEGRTGAATITGLGTPFTALSAGTAHTCGLTSAGVGYCWGLGAELTPVPVPGGLVFMALTAGIEDTCGLTSAGAGYCWGYNSYGQLGDGTTVNRASPVPVAGGLVFTALTLGNGFHTCGVTSAGAAYCWGWNTFGGLGDRTTTDRPAPVPVADGLVFTALSAGGWHTCGLTGAGAAYCWGYNVFGQLGDGETSQQRLFPVAVQGGLVFKELSAGDGHTCGRTSAGVGYCWGNNGNGQLGDGTTVARVSPMPVAGGLVFTALTARGYHTCGLTNVGAAYCWGGNDYGQAGDGTTVDRASPVPVGGGLVFAALTSGYGHTCGRTTTGAAFCWGRNTSGQLGDGTTTDRLLPVAVILP